MARNEVSVPPEYYNITTEIKARWDVCIIKLRVPLAIERPKDIKPASICECITPSIPTLKQIEIATYHHVCWLICQTLRMLVIADGPISITSNFRYLWYSATNLMES